MGQKRRMARHFVEAVKTFDDKAIFVDLFGGSGLLSHVAKRERPDATVVYNDFDNYCARLTNIDRTNALLADIRDIILDVPKEKRIPDVLCTKILERVTTEAATGDVDYITLSAQLFFTMNYASSLEELSRQAMYNNVVGKVFTCDGYLDGLEIMRCDYRELLAKYRNNPNVVFIVDPPYLSTEQSPYESYCKLSDSLDVIKALQSTNYIYFTSSKSHIIELFGWMSEHCNASSPFDKAQSRTVNMTSKTFNYTDIMLFKVA